MTEHRIFEILLQNHNNDYNFDYPKLQEEAVNIATKKFTDIIYDTLKQKSSASSIKRGNVLKFINSLCEVKESHLNEDNYKWFMRIVENSFKHTTEDEDVTKLLGEINSELDYHSSDKFTDHVVAFYKRKHTKRKENVKRLETIKKVDQEKLDLKFDIQVRRNFSYYETNENLIKNLLEEGCARQLENKGLMSQMETTDFREKQVKLAYAIINLKDKTDDLLIEKIVLRISRYKKLEEFEINFLQYIFLLEDDSSNLADLVIEKFPFILERLILKYSTDIIRLAEELDVCQYFVNLEDDKKIMQIRILCKRDTVVYCKLKSLIYELYCYSHCNVNILRLVDFII